MRSAAGRPELLLDPAVAPTADLAVVEVGLGRVDRDDGDAAALRRTELRSPKSSSKCT